MSTRSDRLMPNDVPRYVRCYELITGGWLVVFTRMGRSGSNRYSKKGKGHPYLTATLDSSGCYKTETAEHPNKPIDQDLRYDFSGDGVDFQNLPAKVRQEVRDMYMTLWKIK